MVGQVLKSKLRRSWLGDPLSLNFHTSDLGVTHIYPNRVVVRVKMKIMIMAVLHNLKTAVEIQSLFSQEIYPQVMSRVLFGKV